MQSKERVLRAIRHEEVDRVPFFYHGVGSINEELTKQLGCQNYNEEKLLQRLDADVRFLRPRLVNISGEERRPFQCGNVHAIIQGTGAGEERVVEKFPIEDARTVEDILNYNQWPSPDWYNYEIPADRCKELRDKAVIAYDMGIIFLYAMAMRGMENVMLDMAGNPDMAHALFNKISDYNLGRTRRFLKANEGLFNIVGIGDDVAGQDGLFFSPEMWRTYLKPHVQKMVDLCYEFDVIPYFHGCGGFRVLFPDFIEMGIPCVGRLQTEANGNNFQEIKKEFGKKFCLWGAIDARHKVIESTEDEVREYIKMLLRVGSIGNGYVAGPTHTFTEDTPIKNIVAVYKILREEAL